MADYRTNPEILTSRTILVIAPHADDETFGCAGTMARAKALGSTVYVVYASVGDLEHCSSEHRDVAGSTREAEIQDAARILGIDGYSILYRDARTHLRLDSVPRRDLVSLIERDGEHALNRVRPDVVLLPEPSYNQDHEAVYDAAIAALRPHLHADKPFTPLVMTYDQPQLAWGRIAFQPNVFVEISDYLDVKLRAHACHRSQLRPDPHHGSLANVERLARLRGSEVSVAAAEAFRCARLVI